MPAAEKKRWSDALHHKSRGFLVESQRSLDELYMVQIVLDRIQEKIRIVSMTFALMIMGIEKEGTLFGNRDGWGIQMGFIGRSLGPFFGTLTPADPRS